MCFKISADTVAIATAINGFNASYHRDYFTARAEADDYLSKSPTPESAYRLACALMHALKSWGAEQRRAPACQSVEVATKALRNALLHSNLVKLASCFEYLTLKDGGRALKGGSPFQSVNDFDVCLVETLGELAAVLLVGNTNVTYPMKALLLLTGLMPAFDRQVRGGLHLAGLSGFTWRGKPRTQYLMPSHGEADARRICVLPFYIAACVSSARTLFSKAVASSNHSALKDHHGRLFDILLFMQGSDTSKAPLVTFSPAQAPRRWYDI